MELPISDPAATSAPSDAASRRSAGLLFWLFFLPREFHVQFDVRRVSCEGKNDSKSWPEAAAAAPCVLSAALCCILCALSVLDAAAADAIFPLRPLRPKARDRPTQARSHNRARGAQTHLVVHILNTDKYHISLMGFDGPLLSLFPDLGLWRSSFTRLLSFLPHPPFFSEFQEKTTAACL